MAGEAVESPASDAGVPVCVCWFPGPRRAHHRVEGWYLRYRLSYRDVEDLLPDPDAHVDDVTVTAAVSATVRRRLPIRTAFAGRPMVRRNGPGQRQRRLALGRPGRRPTRADHRRTRVTVSGADDVEGDPGRGGDRRRADLSPSPGRPGPLGLASGETMCIRTDRVRPRQAQTRAAGHAGLRPVATVGSARPRRPDGSFVGSGVGG